MAFDVFKRAWVVFTNPKYFRPALAIMLCAGFAGAFVAWCFGPPPPKPSFLSLVPQMGASLALAGIVAWPGGSLLALAIALAREEDASLGTRFLSFSAYVQYLVVSAAFMVAVMVGVFCLIVPGIFGCVVWSQARALVVDGEAGPIRAFGESRDLTRAWFGDVFATFFAVMVLWALTLGLTFAVHRAGGPSIAQWQWAMIDQVWIAPLAVFMNAIAAALYVELVRANRPLTSAEFSFASPLTH